MIDSLRWFGSYKGNDVHVLANNQPTRPLNQELYVAETGAPNTFRPFITFKATNPTATLQFSLVTLDNGKGVTLNQTTGVVTVAANVDANIHNFLVAATVTLGTESKTIHMRFHIHKSITSAWLSPNPMTVYKNTTGYRFSVYAEFDDKVIGDITFLSRKIPVQNIQWGPADVFISTDGEIDVSTKPDNTPVNITAQLPASFDGHTLNGQIIPKSFPERAQLISTGSSPGFVSLADAPNVLFLADGFLGDAVSPEDRKRFEGMTDHFVRRLARERLSRPYDLLSDSINYWRLFEPSRERGVSMVQEVYIKPTGSQTEAWPLEFPKEKAGALNVASVQAWNITNLIFYVGLPVPGQATTSNDDLRTQWKSILTTADASIDAISDALINSWKERANRRLLEEKDTFLGNFSGRKPAAHLPPTDAPNIFSENEKRLTRQRLNGRLLVLKDQDANHNNVIGSVWDITSSNPGSTPPGPPLGKDWDLIVYIVNSASGREANGEGYFYINPHSDNESNRPITFENATVPGAHGTTSRAIRQVVAIPPAQFQPTPFSILLHELTHSFTLGDEYGEPGNTDFFNYTGPREIVEKYANLQIETDVKNAAGKFDGSLIKWRWHRITKAGVLVELSSTNGQFNVKLHPGQAGAFVINDEVFLRFRKYGEPLIKNVLTSPKLKVVSVDAAQNTVTVTVPSGNLIPNDFPPGSVLYKPGTATSDVKYPYPELISNEMIQYITSEKRPLTGDVDQLDERENQAPLLDGFPTPTCKKHTPRIVGLYEGGMQYHNRIYHPTGTCKMRRGREEKFEFCVVCRYIIVDQINPAKHPDIDRDYDGLVGPESSC